MRLERVALVRAYHEEMVHVAAVTYAQWARAAGERVAIGRGERTALIRPPSQQRQPCAEDGCLQVVEAAVHACVEMHVSVDLAAVTQPPDMAGDRRIVGDDCAAVAECAEILRRIEAES